MRVAVVLLGGALIGLSTFLTACASSGGTDCDPTSETCLCGPSLPSCPGGSGCVDGTCVPGADGGDGFADAGPIGPEIDARHLAGFGEPCTDKLDCASHICIFVGIGGIC